MIVRDKDSYLKYRIVVMFVLMQPIQLVVLRDVRMEGGQTKNFAKVLECSRELKDILRLIKESTENQDIPSETTLSLEVNSENFRMSSVKLRVFV